MLMNDDVHNNFQLHPRVIYPEKQLKNISLLLQRCGKIKEPMEILEQARHITRIFFPEGNPIRPHKLRSHKPDVLEAVKEST